MVDVLESVSFSRIGSEPIKGMTAESIEASLSDGIVSAQDDARILDVEAAIGLRQHSIMDDDR